MVLIEKPIHGISLNGKEYLLDTEDMGIRGCLAIVDRYIAGHESIGASWF